MHQALGPLGHQAWRRSPQATTAQSEARAHEAGGGNAEEEEDHAARGRGGAAGAGACDAALWIQDPVDVGYNVARGLTPAFLLRLQCEIVRAMLVLAGPDSPPCWERAAAL